jgi:hypothetical protein
MKHATRSITQGLGDNVLAMPNCKKSLQVRAMPLRGRSAALRAEPLFQASQAKPAATIAGPSPSFIALTRNPDLEPPTRFVPTIKNDGDVVI